MMSAYSEIAARSSTGQTRPSPRLAQSLMYTTDRLVKGSPSIYKLRMREEMKNQRVRISRQSIGNLEDSVLNKEKVFLLVGATGAGKSTLINGMMNYILDVKWEDNFRFQLITEDDKVSQAYSQTQDISAYTIYPMIGSVLPNYTFTVIDTPGFGATEGLERDKEITRQIKELFSLPPPQGIDHLDGVGFVVQSSQARLTYTQQYIFDSILSIFGKDVSKNFFMMITFADGQRPPVLDAIKKAEMPHQIDRHFKFNNSALYAQSTAAVSKFNFDGMFWELGLSSFTEFFEDLQNSESVSLRLTQEVLQEREQLHMLLDGLHLQISLGLNKIEEIRQEENIIQQHESEIQTNKDFTYEVKILKDRYVDLEGTGLHTTTCLVCNNTCHENCKLADDDDKARCWAMDDGSCRICPGKCIWSEHKNRPYVIKRDLVTETRTSEDLRQKYDKALQGKASSNNMLEEIERNLQKVHLRVLDMIKQTQKSVHRLDEIALKPNPLTEVDYIQLLIESEKNEARPGWKDRVAYFEEALKHAKLLSTVKNEKQLQEFSQKLSRGQSINPGEKSSKWYKRFKFW